MEDISLHILDIVENSVAAGASAVNIAVCEDIPGDVLDIEISDNGKGMSKEILRKATDPFFTSKTVRKVGLGLTLLKQATEMANGTFSINSKEGRGTIVKVSFQYSHIDRQPLGDIGKTIEVLVIGNPGVDFHYEHKKDGFLSTFDTKRIRKVLSKMSINSTKGIEIVRESLKKTERYLSKAESR